MMTVKISEKDYEALSAYLDDELNVRERKVLEERLAANEEMKSALKELQRTRAILRSEPRLRAPRNFTLKPEWVGAGPARPRAAALFPVFRFASILAALLFGAVFIGDLLAGGMPMASAPAPQAYEAALSTEVAVEKALPVESAAEVQEQPAAETPVEMPVAPEPTSEVMAMEAPPPAEVPGAVETAASSAKVQPRDMENLTEPPYGPETGMGGGPPGEGGGEPAEGFAPPAPLPAPTIAAVEPMAMPAPLATETEETSQALEKPQELNTPGPAPTEDLALALQTAAESTAGEPALGLGESEQPVQETPLQPRTLPALQIVEIALALIAVSAGLAAVLLRRWGG